VLINGVPYTREQYEALSQTARPMPESPDFDQIARAPVEELRKYFLDDGPGRDELGQTRRVIRGGRDGLQGPERARRRGP